MTPSGPGTSTATTTATVSGLTASTTYYLFVRSVCSSSYSSWSAAPPVTTPAGSGSCTPPTPGAMAISCDTGGAMWPAVSGAMGYEVAVTTSSTPPASGTSIATTMFAVAGLSGSTTYYAHIRTDCGMGTYSSWATASFTTPACPTCSAPAGISKTPTSSDVSLSWSAVPGAMAYEYKVSTSSSTPTAAGTSTTSTSMTVPGLSPGTSYYAFIRTKCAGGVYSPWSSAQAFATSPTAVNNVDDNRSNSLFEVFPNPVSFTMSVIVKTSVTHASALTVSAADGRVVKTVAITGNSISVDVSDLASGVYFVRYADGAQTQVAKMVKQ